jgi:hypothetical protein
MIATMGQTEARKIALEHLNVYPLADDERIIIEDATVEKEYGWIFFYNSRKHLETGDILYALAGNGPLVVKSADGSIISWVQRLILK